jgi:hypothetical protein
MGTSEGGNLMKHTTLALGMLLVLGLSVPASARPLAPPQHHQRSAWVSLWNGLVRAIGSPFRLFDDPAPDSGGTHTIPIIAPTPPPGS